MAEQTKQCQKLIGDKPLRLLNNIDYPSDLRKLSINDLPEVWTHFLPRQFFTFLAASILFFVLMVLIGFYPAAILYLVFMMHFFLIEKKYMAITVVVLMVLIYIVFSEFLAVPLPAGLLLDELL